MKKLLYIVMFFAIFGGTNLYSQLEPVLLTPDNESKCQGLEVELSWTQKVNATGYNIQVTKTSGDYSNLVIDETNVTTTTYDAVLGDNSSTFYWRVRANYSGTFAWSDEFWFETRRAGTTTELPIIGDVCQQSPVLFQWAEMGDVTSYHLQISPNESFNNLEVNNLSLTTNTFSTPLNQSYIAYYWRVRANYSSGTISCISEWSNSASFSTAVLPPFLDFPANGNQGQDFAVNFIWTPQNGSASYTFQLSETPSFGTITHEAAGLSDTQYNFQLEEEFNKQYFWRVKAISSSLCESEWSNTFSFRTRFADVVLSSPEDGASCIAVENAELTWNNADGVQSYRVQVSEDPNFPIPVQFDLVNVTSNTFNIDLPNSLTTYHWRVRAEDGNNIGNWSERRSFTSGLFAPSLVLPVNDSTETFIITNLTWESQNATAFFNIQVSSDPNFSEDNLIANETGLTDKNFDVTLPEYGADYYWRVSASFTQCNSNWSDVRKFTTMNGTPELVSPENNSTNQPLSVAFDWSDVKFAINYDLEISRSENFSVIQAGRIAIDTSIIFISNLEPTTTYYWRVRTNTGISKAPYSEIRSFTTGVEPSIRPLKIEPRDLSEKRPVNEVFRWTSSENADFYEFQISSDEDFNEIVDNGENLEDTTFVVEGLENYTVYYWRVRSGNSSGESVWTVPWRFKTIAPTITETSFLSSPENEATEIDHRRVNFEWLEVLNTTEVKGGYHLQVSRTADFSSDIDFDSRSIFDTKHSVFNINHTTTYYWRVRGYNEAGDGPWSEVWSFTTLDFSSVVSEYINDISISPNPVNQDNLTLNFNLEKTGLTEISIFNVKGNEVLKLAPKQLMQGNHNLNINLNNLSNGSYILVIDNEGNRASINFNIVK